MATSDRALRLLTVALASGLAGLVACLEGDANALKQSGPPGPGSSGFTSSASGSPSQPIPTVEPGNACSPQSPLAVTVTFRNATRDRSLELSWVDFQCKEVRYATIAPGGVHSQPTFVSHVWRLRDTETGALYIEFAPTTSSPSDVSVP
jgi:hypothetical protein